MRRMQQIGCKTDSRVGRPIVSGQTNTNSKIGTITSNRTGTIIVTAEITGLLITGGITIVITVIKDSRLSWQAMTHRMPQLK